MHTLTREEIEEEPVPAYLGNGMVGLRVPPIPTSGREVFVQGYVGESPEARNEAMLPAPDPLGLELALGPDWLAEQPSAARFVDQQLELASGELTSRFRVRFPDDAVDVVVTTLTLRQHPMAVAQRVALTPAHGGRLTARAQIDWRGHMGELIERVMPGRLDRPRKEQEADAIMHWRAPGGMSRLGIAHQTRVHGRAPIEHRRNDYGHELDRALTDYLFDLEGGETVVLEQVAALVPSVCHEQPHWQASRMVAHAVWRGADKLRAENREAWAEVWRGRPILHGAGERWQQISDACYYALHSSVSPASLMGPGPFGLSHRNYDGHVFWDYETFMYPGLLLSAPEAAEATMEHRWRATEMAAHHARMHGRRGIQFPWQSGLSGSEMTAYYANAREFHVNAAVALAFAQYAWASGDPVFTRERAWPVLRGVAAWIESFVTRTERGYETHHLASPNEKFHDVHNDLQTHLFMREALKAADACARAVGHEPPARWRAIAEGLVMPVDPDHDLYTQFEGYRRGVHGAGSIGPMYAMFPLGGGFPDADRQQRTYERFVEEDVWRYAGMPMSSAFCGVWAARMGRPADALGLLERGIASRVIEPWQLMGEAAPSINRAAWLTKRTSFVTGQGGLVTALLLGFPGLEIGPGKPARDWPVAAPALPEGWEAIEVEQMWVHGRPHRMIARQDAERAELERIADA